MFLKWIWLWIVKVNEMPATLGGQITLVLGIVLSVLAIAKILDSKYREIIKHAEWFELLMIDYARRTGYELPKDLIDRHMKLNGNAALTSEDKDRIYGPNRPPSDPKRKSARARGMVPDEKETE